MRRAYKELLEISSQNLTAGEKTFKMFYTLDGELMDEIKYITPDITMLLVSESKDSCKGLYDPKEKMNIKEQRINHC